MAGRNPFDVLGINPEAEIEVVAAAYRALARKYHPDLNPGVDHAELNRRMTELNWAKEQLDTDLTGWRVKMQSSSGDRADASSQPRAASGSASADSPATEAAIEAIPPVVFVPGRAGAGATFEAHALGAASGLIKARFRSSNLQLTRIGDSVGLSRFSVTLSDDFASDIPDNVVEVVELVAPGYRGCKLFVSIAPLTEKVLRQEYPGGRVAPPRHASPSARISFGKHRGREFSHIAVEEPGYLKWMLREGAGSHVERECARMALQELSGGTTLAASKRPAARSLPRRPATPAPALPDPNRPGGLLGALRSIFGAKR